MTQASFELSHQHKPIYLWSAIIAAGALLLLAGTLWANFKQTVEDRNRNAVVYSRMVEGALTRTLESVETALVTTAEEIDLTGDHQATALAVSKPIQNMLRFAPHIRQIILLDGDRVLLNSHGEPDQILDQARVHFHTSETHNQLSRGLAIGHLVYGRFLPLQGEEPPKSKRRSLLPLSLEVPGKPTLRLVVALNSRYLTDLFGGLNLEKADDFAILSLQGEVLIASQAAADWTDASAVTRTMATEDRDEQQYAQNHGGVLPQSYTAVKLSGKYPLAIALRLDHQATFYQWIGSRPYLLALLGGAVLLVIGATVLLMRMGLQAQHLQEEVLLMYTAIHQSPVSVIITDGKRRIEYANPAFTKTFGYTFDEVRGQTPALLKSGLTSADVYARMWATLNAGEPWQGEFINRTKLGDIVPITCAISPIRKLDGSFSHMIGVLTDVSDIKAMQKDAEYAFHRAENASKAKSNFLATMSHELRTPMTGIRGIIELLKLEDGLPIKTKDLIKDLDSSTNALLMLLNDVLDLSKIEAGKLTVEHAPCEPAAIAENIIQIFKESASERGNLLVSNAEQLRGDWCLSDGLRLRQILSNLVSNAVKFTQSGEVRVELDLNDQPDGSSHLSLMVQDTGIGMSDEQLTRIFNPFTQADSSTTRKFGGTGLGLAITKELVSLMEGSIDVTSGLNEGSRFHIILPVQRVEAPQVAEQHKGSQNSLTVLLAEDNAINQKVVKAMLSRHGHTVTLADNGLEALVHAQSRTFDVILMDMQMPEMDGEEATSRIRAEAGPNQKTPILAFTADAITENHTRYRHAGVDDIITKPARWDLLNAKLSHYASTKERG